MPQSQSVENIAKALAKAQGRFETFGKNRLGQDGYQKFMYSTLSAVLDAVRPALNAEGIFLSQPVVTDENGKQRVTTRVQLGDEWIASGGVLLSDGLVGSKQFGKEVTYSRRYDLMAFLGVCGEDDDQDAPDLKPGDKAPSPKAAPKPVVQHQKPSVTNTTPAVPQNPQPIVTNGVFSATNEDLPKEIFDDGYPEPSEPQMEPELADLADNLGRPADFVPLSEKRNNEIQSQLREWTKAKTLPIRSLSAYLDKAHEGKKSFDVPAKTWEDTFKKISDAVAGGPEAIKTFFKENK